ncbi:hypothetical protein CDAR_569761 [Caerostris darwini]|uniref:Uncharacterized protein n=1 Tax=Caerostris darwini TaxID=1538125 RepID=A0AAV4S2V7_9ARAC|nr:hypothetical protein CDAR_569761 [Caerostris darwini]
MITDSHHYRTSFLLLTSRTQKLFILKIVKDFYLNLPSINNSEIQNLLHCDLTLLTQNGHMLCFIFCTYPRLEICSSRPPCGEGAVLHPALIF